MVKKSLYVLVLLVMVTGLLVSLPLPAHAQPEPPQNADEAWDPPDEEGESIAPSVSVDEFTGTLDWTLPPPTPGRGIIVNAYLADAFGRPKTSFRGGEIIYLMVGVSGQGFLSLYEYYPTGWTGRWGHWLFWRWWRGAGIWRIGPFYPEQWQPDGMYTWRLWFNSGGFTTSRTLRFHYYRGTGSNNTQQGNSLPVINSFNANPTSIEQGQSTNLSWNVSNANSVNITPLGSYGNSGSTADKPTSTTTYTLTATDNKGNSKTQSVTVTVTPKSIIQPTITVNPPSVDFGQAITLTWNAPGATQVVISGVGNQQASGSWSINPDRTTTYNLTAYYSDGTQRFSSASVNVSDNRLTYAIIGILILGLAAVIFVAMRQRATASAPTFPAGGTGSSAGTRPADTRWSQGTQQTNFVSTAPSASFCMPDGSRLNFSGSRSFGRHDLGKYVSAQKVEDISRQHLFIMYENNQYFIEDRGSTNGTRLNGVDIKGLGKRPLNRGDNIEIAGILSAKFES